MSVYMESRYKKVILKLSGESLANRDDARSIESIGQEIDTVIRQGTQMGIVIGGGNIFRGHSHGEKSSSETRIKDDQIGMLATIINGLALSKIFAQIGLKTLIQSAIGIDGMVDRFSVENSTKFMESGGVVIFCAGTGNPYFSTDTAAALRACELGADVLLKATTVDGIYDKNPKMDKNAKKLEKIDYIEALSLGIAVMDFPAFALCKENDLNIIIFNMNIDGNIIKAIHGEQVGSIVGKF
ncbi:MAG: UMP kinase [Puniceicoccales bacterium]|nr:UMP kinase [Puniceicoccales bacterium]